MITEDYVSYEVAVLLKEKGFDGYCGQIYDNDKYLSRNLCGYVNEEKANEFFSALAPTYQMAMKWLREKRWVISIISKSFYADGRCTSWTYSIWADDNLEIDGEEEWENIYGSYEEATEAALKYSLENLM